MKANEKRAKRESDIRYALGKAFAKRIKLALARMARIDHDRTRLTT